MTYNTNEKQMPRKTQPLEGITLMLYDLAGALPAIRPQWLGSVSVDRGLDYVVARAIIGHDGFSATVIPFRVPTSCCS